MMATRQTTICLFYVLGLSRPRDAEYFVVVAARHTIASEVLRFEYCALALSKSANLETGRHQAVRSLQNPFAKRHFLSSTSTKSASITSSPPPDPLEPAAAPEAPVPPPVGPPPCEAC